MTDLERIAVLEKLLNIKAEKVAESDSYLLFFHRQYFKYQINKEGAVIAILIGEHKLNDMFWKVLQRFDKLKILYLTENKLVDLSPLSSLSGIQILHLGGNEISNLSSLSSLSGIQTLRLGGNQISDLSALSSLSGIKRLDLSHNQVSDLSALSSLSGIQILGLSHNQVSDLSPLSSLSGIQILDLSHNQVSDLSPLSCLLRIQELRLTYNQISDLSPLSCLSGIQTLDLQENQIKKIPVHFLEKIELETIILDKYIFSGMNFYGNPIITPPLEIVAKGRQAMLNYYTQLDLYGEEIMYEGKLVILGEAGAGKTTLFEKLQKPELGLPDTSSTLGVQVKEGLVLPHPSETEVELTANLWDFGGQEVQYQLHQYFISPDSLYVIVSDNRKEKTRWNYWFQVINLLGKSCPVIVVLNNNGYEGKDNFPLEACQKNFPELQIEQVKVDFSTNDFRWQTLQETIRYQLADLPLVKKPIPRPWKLLRNNLTETRKEKNYITISQFFDLCPEELENEDNRLQALGYFHSLGIVLHFKEDENLQNLVFLNPQWIADAIYVALDGQNEELESGSFQKEWIFEFWKKHENQYNFEERGYLLQLMLKDNFDICYPVGQNRFIVPMLLPESGLDFEWSKQDNLGFRIQYPFMPKGIFSRLVVRLNQYIKSQLVWASGMVLEEEQTNCQAKVIGEKDVKTGLQRIAIHVSGGSSLQERKSFLSIIRKELLHIHKTSFPNIRITEQVVCNCSKCKEEEQPYYFNLPELKEYLEEGNPQIECRKLKRGVSIHQLLGTVLTKQEENAFLGRESKNYGLDENALAVRKEVLAFMKKGKCESAIELLEDYFEERDEEEFVTNLVLMNGTLNTLNRKKRKGTITDNDYDTKIAQIGDTILGYLEDL
jgi:internalin A